MTFLLSHCKIFFAFLPNDCRLLRSNHSNKGYKIKIYYFIMCAKKNLKHAIPDSLRRGTDPLPLDCPMKK